MNPESALIPRSTITEVVAYRNAAVARFDEAFRMLDGALAAFREAESFTRDACDGETSYPYSEKHRDEIAAFRSTIEPRDIAKLTAMARRLTDIQVWSSIIQRTELEALMDKEAKDQLRRQMEYVPERVDPATGAIINEAELAKGLPPVSEESIETMLDGFRERAAEIWRRGIANAFSGLDRRFRSHDGFKIGGRVVLSSAFDQWGHWNHWSNHRDTIIDIERIFLVLDGQSPRAPYGGIIGVIENDRRGGGLEARQSQHAGDYFKVRIFKNGNAHLWFTRDDLVEKVNLLLAEHYGAGLGWGKADQEEPEAAFRGAVERAPAKRYGFFPTPDELAERVVREASILSEEPLAILEPSAGTGQLASRLARPSYEHVAHYSREELAPSHRVTAVEVQGDLAEQLDGSGLYARVLHRDFLSISPSPTFDRVVMNPPFDRGRDIDHVNHALGFLKPGGRLVAIMSASTEFSETARAKAFRRKIKELGGKFRDLPAGSFRECGTNVNTVLLTVNAPSSDA